MATMQNLTLFGPLTFFILLLSAYSSFKTVEGTVSEEWDSALKGVQQAFDSVGDWVAKEVKKVEDLFAKSTEDLGSKINETLALLTNVQTHKDEIRRTAPDEETKKAVDNVDQMVQIVKDAKDDYEKDKTKPDTETWKNRANALYDGGLDKLIAYASRMKNAASSRFPVLNLTSPLALSLLALGIHHAIIMAEH